MERSRGQPLTAGCGLPTSLARVSYKREQGSRALPKVSPWPWPGTPSQGAFGTASHGGRGPGLASLNPASYPAADCPRDPGNALSSRGSQALICNVAMMTRQGFSLPTYTVNKVQRAAGHAKACGGTRGQREPPEFTGSTSGRPYRAGVGAPGKASWRRCHSTSDLRGERDMAG